METSLGGRSLSGHSGNLVAEVFTVGTAQKRNASVGPRRLRGVPPPPQRGFRCELLAPGVPRFRARGGGVTLRSLSEHVLPETRA